MTARRLTRSTSHPTGKLAITNAKAYAIPWTRLIWTSESRKSLLMGVTSSATTWRSRLENQYRTVRTRTVAQAVTDDFVAGRGSAPGIKEDLALRGALAQGFECRRHLVEGNRIGHHGQRLEVTGG